MRVVLQCVRLNGRVNFVTPNWVESTATSAVECLKVRSVQSCEQNVCFVCNLENSE